MRRFRRMTTFLYRFVYRIGPPMSMFQRKKLLILAQIPALEGDWGVFNGLGTVVGAFAHS